MSKLINSLRNFRTTFSEWKVYLNRSLTYLSVANFLIILFLFFIHNSKYLPFAATKTNLIILAVFLMFLAVILGWIDVKLGLYNAEQNKAAQHNPYFTETKTNTDKILQKIDCLETEVRELKKRGQCEDSINKPID